MSGVLLLAGAPTAEAVESWRSRLTEQGYTLTVVDSAAEAIDAAHNASLAAILVDVTLPHLNGIQLCCQIKANGNHALPVIALNQGCPPLRRAALAVGADMVFDYPLDVEEMLAWLALPVWARTPRQADDVLFGASEQDISGTTALLSHDLKSPIGTIVSSLEALLFMSDEETDTATRTLLRGTLDVAYRQLRMISEFIDLARLQTNEYDLELVEADLVPLIRDSLAAQNYTIELKGLRVEVDLPHSETLWASVDTDLMQRVVSALVDNVMKFTTREDTLRVSALREGSTIVITFADTGRAIFPGYEDEILARTSQWVGRQAGSRTSVAMGLPFIYSVARAHGGNFSARTDPTSGWTSFTFKLPLLDAVK